MYAAQDGVVVVAHDNDKTKKSWGNYVKIDHGNNVYTLYGHLKQGLKVKVGQKVRMADLIGHMGNTGDSGGNHLHYEVYESGSSTSCRVNPQSRTYVYPNQTVSAGTKKMTDVLYYTGEKQLQYQSYANKLNKWLPKVKTGTGEYAGIKGSPMSGLKIQELTYRTHDKSKGCWLPWVTGTADYAGILTHDIDGVQIKNAKYRARLVNGKLLPWVNGTSDYAGIIGKSIATIEIKID